MTDTTTKALIKHRINRTTACAHQSLGKVSLRADELRAKVSTLGLSTFHSNLSPYVTTFSKQQSTGLLVH